MYEPYFGLNRRPFSATPDPDCFVENPEICQILDELLLCVRSGQGISVLTAPAGTGKTQVCRKLLAELSDSFVGVFLANSNFPTRRSLLQAMLYELGHPYIRMAEQELRLELTTAVRNVRPKHEAVVLVADEAHLLSERLLEEIRTITSISEDGESLVRVVLSGQLPLEETLTVPALAALNQRIRCQVSLQSFTRQQSAEYIAQRMQWAGGDVEQIFTPETLQAICHASDGLPRCLNQLADHCLLLAYVAEQKPVELATVREALDDLRQLPLHWNEAGLVLTPLEQLKNQSETGTSADDANPESYEFQSQASSEAESRFNSSPAFSQATESDPDTQRDEGDSAQHETSADVACFEVGAPETDETVADNAATIETVEAAAAIEIGHENAADRTATPADQKTTGHADVSLETIEICDSNRDLAGRAVVDVLVPIEDRSVLAIGPSPGEEWDTRIGATWEAVDPLVESAIGSQQPSLDAAVDETRRQDKRTVAATITLPPAIHQPVTTVHGVGGYDEELVFDRYAMLEAQQRNNDQSGIIGDESATHPERVATSAEPVKSATIAESPPAPVERPPAVQKSRESGQPVDTIVEPMLGLGCDDFLWEPRPDKIIDEVIPLLDKVLDPNLSADDLLGFQGDAGSVSSRTLNGGRGLNDLLDVAVETKSLDWTDVSDVLPSQCGSDGLRIDVNLETPTTTAATTDSENDLDEQIRSAVLEVCLMAQQAIGNRWDDSAASMPDAVLPPVSSRTVESQLDEYRRPDDYDVVQPELAESASGLVASADQPRGDVVEPSELTHPGRQEPREPLGQLFSQLRRRHSGQT